jgi:hypothetical protein
VSDKTAADKTAADNTDMKMIQPKINVNCDCCDNSDFATKSELIQVGWLIEKHWNFARMPLRLKRLARYRKANKKPLETF